MSGQDFAETLERGTAAHAAGRLDEALQLYRSALAVKPGDAEALSLCGLALVHRGEPREGLPLLERAVTLEPGQAGFRMNLAEGLARAGEHERALRELQVVVQNEPGNARALQRAHMINAEVLAAKRAWPALAEAATAWVRAFPQDHEAWRAAARAAFELGRHLEAMGAFERVLALRNPTAVDLTSYAGLCLHALEIESATKALERAEALDPNYAPLLSNRALLSMYLGRFEEAESYCRRCLAQAPEFAPAYTILSRVRRGNLTEADLAAASRIARRVDAPVEHRIATAFSVAHAHDANDDIDAAYAAYEYAHALAMDRDRQENRRYDTEEADRRAGRIKDAAEQAPALDGELTAGRLQPIFIVGMPRSGTTLIESVVAAHSRVFAGGERPIMQHILRASLALQESGRKPDARTMREWTEAYFTRTPPGVDRVTDKHPLNFEAAGLVAKLWPQAVMVHVRRNPLENCLSVFRQEFTKHWAFAHRLEDIAHYYGHYARLVSHWERTLGGRFVTIRYEEFVQDFASAAPELVRICGLEWEEQCLHFQDSPRAITTFSTVQAREPVRLANGRAAKYARHLERLKAALENAGVDPEA